MTSQIVVVPIELEMLVGRLQAVATDIEHAERWLRAELAAVWLNAADPSLSTTAFNARASDVNRSLQWAVRQTSEEVSQVEDARREALAADAAGATAIGDFIVDYLLGDVAAFWGRQGDRLDLASMATGAIRVGRTAAYLLARPEYRAAKFPVFNTGFVGQQLAAGLQRIPVVSGAGTWLGSPAATSFFKWAGVTGAVIGTGAGLYNLYQQGNPIDAFEREGAGYVADLANTAFSASTAAFLLAPNPVTGGLVIVTGAVWLGAEVVDNWDDISATAGELWESGTDLLADGAGLVADGAGALLDGGGALLDGAGSLASGIGGAISDWF